MCIRKARSVSRKNAFEDGQALCGKEKPERTAGDREQNAFGEELAGDSAATRSEGGADRDFFFASCRSREREIGNVGAGDEDDKDYGSEQHEQAKTNVRHHAAL